MGNVLFCAFVVFFIITAVLSSGLANAESERHKNNYVKYEAADELYYDDEKYDKALILYKELIPLYPKAYILEYKAAMCEYFLANYSAARDHGIRALELWPFLVRDEDFMIFFKDALKLSGDEAGSA